MTEKIPRMIIAGTNSGSGKTTVTCAIMRALVKRGVVVSPYKCGPDYIDPMFHKEVTGTASGNIDTFLFDNNTAKYLLAKNTTGIALIEGVMGYYDGAGEDGSIGSTYSLAKVTDTPVVLVVNCKGLSFSAVAMIKGFVDYREESLITGVILNNITQSVYQSLKPLIEKELGIKVFGMFPKLPEELVFESRHLGLVTPAELEGIHGKLDALAETAEKFIDLNSLLETACEAKSLTFSKPPVKAFPEKIKIALAEDKAFCFIYRDNISLLEQMGAEVIPFSPLSSEALPDDVSGLLIYGGYPELYLEELAKNQSLLRDIRKKLSGGLPCIAECGGFMYLNRTIGDVKMVGYLGSDCYKTNKLTRFGYITITAGKDNLLCEKGESINAHEYHYFDCNEPGEDFKAVKPSGKEWNCVIARDNLFAGFPHIHFYANTKFAERFYECCIKYRSERQS